MTAPEEQIQLRLASAPQWWSLHRLQRDLIYQMLRVNPADRISSHEALKHPWFVLGRNETLRAERKFVEMKDLKAMAVYGKTPVLRKITQMFMAVRLDHNST